MNVQLHPAAYRWTPLVLALLFGVAPDAMAQYKVIGPDGKVTYTDRPPTQAAGAAQGAGAVAAAAAPVATPVANLPLVLRQAATRYPVTLYAQPSCEGCDAGRAFLRQRGIPYAEKLVGNNDAEALQRETGGRSIPALAIGGQVLRGYSGDQWASYLDAAGYPRESMLPANYVAPAPTLLVPLRPDVPVSPAAPPTGLPLPPPPEPTPGGIRF